MAYGYTEDELEEAHAAHQEHFEQTDNKLGDMRQTVAYQTEQLSQWIARFCRGSAPSFSRRAMREIEDSKEVFNQQLSAKQTALDELRPKEAAIYQKLSDLLNIL